jgi:hypothetical protein
MYLHGCFIQYVLEPLSYTGMAETTGAAVCLAKNFAFAPFNLLVACDYHLSNAFAIGDSEWFVRQVYKYYAHLPTVVGVDCTG